MASRNKRERAVKEEEPAAVTRVSNLLRLLDDAVKHLTIDVTKATRAEGGPLNPCQALNGRLLDLTIEFECQRDAYCEFLGKNASDLNSARPVK